MFHSSRGGGESLRGPQGMFEVVWSCAHVVLELKLHLECQSAVFETQCNQDSTRHALHLVSYFFVPALDSAAIDLLASEVR